jgi:hypothetical protein
VEVREVPLQELQLKLENVLLLEFPSRIRVAWAGEAAASHEMAR